MEGDGKRMVSGRKKRKGRNKKNYKRVIGKNKMPREESGQRRKGRGIRQ